jgi:hypothetical protein
MVTRVPSGHGLCPVTLLRPSVPVLATLLSLGPPSNEGLEVADVLLYHHGWLGLPL